MNHVPSPVATDYHDRCAAELERVSDILDHSIAFIESVILAIQPECFTREERADLSEWLSSTRSAREALR